MTDADVRFIMNFAEHVPSETWEDSYKIASFVLNCWDWCSAEKSWNEIASFSAIDSQQWLKEWSSRQYGSGFLKDNRRDGTYFVEKEQFYGNMYDTMYETEKGMREYFPNIDYELVCYICNCGEASEDVVIVDGGKRYSRRLNFRFVTDYIDEDLGEWEDLDEWEGLDEDEKLKIKNRIQARDEFKTPEPTEDNPFSIPAAIFQELGGYYGDKFRPVVGFWKRRPYEV